MVRSIKSRCNAILLALLLVSVQLFAPIAAIVPRAAAASEAANLDQWANATPTSWQNGDLNTNNSAYREGESVPFRAILTNLTSGTHTLDIGYDNVSSSKHAYDYLTSFDRSYTPNPCDGISSFTCTAGTSGTIPADPTLSITQAAGQFKIYGSSANITSVAYISTPGHNLSGGNLTTSIRVTFTTNDASAVIAWGGHIAQESDWGIGTGASAINGSPYHQSILALDGASAGQQDRSMKASAVILIPYITVTKIVQSGTALPSDFSFTISPAVNGIATYSIPSGQNSVTIFNVTPNGSYTITESGPSGYGFVSGSGTNCTFIGSTATASVAQGSASNVKNASCTFTNAQQTGTITLLKTVINNNGGTASANDFGLTIGGTAVTSGQTLTLPTGSYAVNEAGLSGYVFVSITGTGCPTTLGGTVTLTNNANITCTITNDDIAPSLTLVKKVTNDNGGNAQPNAWTLTASGPTTIYGAGGVTSGATFKAGTYSLSESGGPSGYAASSWNCVGGSQNGSSITLGLGDSATCTITNDDIAPSLYVTKRVLNSHGGTFWASQFNLYVNGNLLTNPGKGGGTIADNSVTYGYANAQANTTYTISEDQVSGYNQDSIVCTDNDTQTTVAQPVSLTPGQSVTCVVTNSDVAPVLTVIKNAVNPYGTALPASSFPLFVDGTSVTTGTPYATFNAGSHTISETQQNGYSFTGVSGDCTVDGQTGVISVLLSLGTSSSCTLTNTAIQPKLVVIKHVINDNGGKKSAGNFTMTVSGNSATVSNFPGNENGTTVYLNEGSYSVDELTTVGYTKTLSADCSGTISIGETKTCTVTNDDQPGTLIVKKVVVNPYGGTKQASDFSFSINGGTRQQFNANGENDLAVDSGSYTITEPTYPGYAASYDNCTNVTIANGGTATCTITNTDLPAQLTVTKIASPSTDQSFNFTSNELGNFSLTGDGTATSTKTFALLSAGSYSFSELATDNWKTTDISCDNEQESTNGSMTVSLDLGDSVSCYVSNVKLNTITGHKFNDVNKNHAWDNGEPTLANWTITLAKGCDVNTENTLDLLTVDQTPTCTGAVNLTTTTDASGAYSFSNLAPGTYTVCEVQQPKWEQTFPQTSNGCYELTITGPGQVVTADFGNHPIPQVLGRELVNTGASALQNVVFGLAILGALGALHLLTRRQTQTN